MTEARHLMMRKFHLTSITICLFLAMAGPLTGQSLQSLDKRTHSILSSADRWQLALDAFAKDQPHQALRLAKSAIGKLDFRDRPHALFLIGECQYRLGEWDLAAVAFSKVVELERGGDFLEPSLNYLWQIAEKYRKKAPHHLLGYENLPRWSTSQSPCLPLYNQISEALPFSDLAEKALLAKGRYLRQIGDLGHSSEALQSLIYGFPGSSGAGESYRLIGLNLLDLMLLSPGDEELLSHAISNVTRFQKSFSNRSEEVEMVQNVEKMRTLLAGHLIKTGQFYERKTKKDAARVYYERVMSQFLQTASGPIAQKKLAALDAIGP